MSSVRTAGIVECRLCCWNTIIVLVDWHSNRHARHSRQSKSPEPRSCSHVARVVDETIDSKRLDAPGHFRAVPPRPGIMNKIRRHFVLLNRGNNDIFKFIYGKRKKKQRRCGEWSSKITKQTRTMRNKLLICWLSCLLLMESVGRCSAGSAVPENQNKYSVPRHIKPHRTTRTIICQAVLQILKKFLRCRKKSRNIALPFFSALPDYCPNRWSDSALYLSLWGQLSARMFINIVSSIVSFQFAFISVFFGGLEDYVSSHNVGEGAFYVTISRMHQPPAHVSWTRACNNNNKWYAGIASKI